MVATSHDKPSGAEQVSPVRTVAYQTDGTKATSNDSAESLQFAPPDVAGATGTGKRQTRRTAALWRTLKCRIV